MQKADTRTTCKIDNQTAQSVVIVDARTTTSGGKEKAATGYEQTLKILPLQSGAAAILPSQSDAVALDDARDEDRRYLLYDLLISQPVGLTPVFNVAQMPDETGLYPPVRIPAEAPGIAAKALNFCQNIMAYPASDLAKNFLAALQGTKTASTAKDIDAAVKAFFDSTQGFKGVDLSYYVAASSHLRAFAWTWGLDSGRPGRKYWIYSQKDVGGSAPSSQGTLEFTPRSGKPAPAKSDDPQSGYQITIQAGGGTIDMSFRGGQLVDSLNVDVPSVCLQGVYGLKSTFTQKATDNVLWPVFVGVVNGQQVICISQEPEDSFLTWIKGLKPKTAGDWINGFMYVVGFLMCIQFVVQGAIALKRKLQEKLAENKGKEPTKEQVEEAQEEVDLIQMDDRADLGEAANRFGNVDGEPVVERFDPDRIAEAQQKVSDSQAAAGKEMAGDKAEAAMGEVRGQIDAIAKVSTDDDLEDAVELIQDAEGNLHIATETGDFSGVNEKIGQANEKTASAAENVGEELSAETRNALESSRAAVAEYTETSERLSEEARETGEGSNEEYEPEFEVVP